MDIIKLLPKNISNQIAAGEVIQRPSSVVKELIENSIDSGAENIELIIKDAGKTLIQVVDNGCGMSENDLILSIERHSTSKIKNANDLFSIKTMGFRGEAMSSISSISHLEIKTCQHSEDIGRKINVENGKIKDKQNISCSKGTSISVKNLFYNVPARRKFLKSEKVELKHIIDEFQKLSISHSNINFKLFHNENVLFELKKSNLKNRIVNIFGRSYNEKLIPIQEATSLININGFIFKPEFLKKTRGEQYFFVNKRFIKSNYLNHAIKSAFEGLISEKQYVGYFLFFDIEPNLIDINIHPTKTEIKFQDEKSIYAIIKSSTKRTLAQNNLTPSLDFQKDLLFTPNLIDNREVKAPKIKIDSSYNPFNIKNKNNLENWENIFNENLQKTDDNNHQFTLEKNWNETNLYKKNLQVHNNFIISTIKSGLIIINQIRAQEKILFEQLINQNNNDEISQQLLFPEIINLSLSDIKLVEELKDEILKIGFSFEIMGKNKISVHGVPSEIPEEDLQSIFEDFLENFKNYSNITLIIKEKICRSLSKSMCNKKGKKLSDFEMNNLIDTLFSYEDPFHTSDGRKIIKTISLEDLKNEF